MYNLIYLYWFSDFYFQSTLGETKWSLSFYFLEYCPQLETQRILSEEEDISDNSTNQVNLVRFLSNKHVAEIAPDFLSWVIELIIDGRKYIFQRSTRICENVNELRSWQCQGDYRNEKFYRMLYIVMLFVFVGWRQRNKNPSHILNGTVWVSEILIDRCSS